MIWSDPVNLALLGLACAGVVTGTLCCFGETRRSLVSFLATVWLWVAFWGSHFACLVLQVAFLVTVGWAMPGRVRRSVLGHCQQVTILPLMNLNPFWWVRVVRAPKGGIPRGSVVMANHLSYVDSWVVAASIFPIAPKFIASEFLFKMPVFGWVMRLAGHIPVPFTFDAERNKWRVKEGAGEIILERAKGYLDEGFRVVVFPEGNLSPDGELLEFKGGFFKLAHEHGFPIVPVAQNGNQDLFPPGSQFAMAGFARCKVAIGDPVVPGDFETPELLRDHVRDMVQELKDGMVATTIKAVEARAAATSL